MHKVLDTSNKKLKPLFELFILAIFSKGKSGPIGQLLSDPKANFSKDSVQTKKRKRIIHFSTLPEFWDKTRSHYHIVSWRI